jgi:hypothetical protein
MFDLPASTVAPNILLVNLACLRGAAAICDRIPAQPGVYAFFKTFSPPDPESSDAEAFASYLINQATAQHCLPRDGRIKPLYAVRLSSRKTVSASKRQQLIRMCESPSFRVAIDTALKHSLFFEQPLYVGKSNCLRKRIRQHLAPESTLRSRFKKVGIDIFQSRLICLQLDALAGALGPPPDAVEADVPDETGESPLEEILSKLFHPLFVQRYG